MSGKLAENVGAIERLERENAARRSRFARIGDSVRISPEGKPAHFDGPNFYVRDGIVVVPKNAVIMSGTEI